MTGHATSTELIDAGPTGGRQTRKSLRSGLVRLATASSVIVAWYLCRPYLGIVHDARLYIGRALADIHPASVGRELTFVHDGQSQFSAYPVFMRIAVEAFGAGRAALLFTALGLIAWIAAATFLTSRFARGRLLWACLVCIAALPSGYGGFHIFHWAEAFATPRLFAEAAGLTALALLLDGRKLSALALFAVAALLHPIMALPVAGVGFVYLVIEDRRWMLLAGIGLAVIVLALAFKLPVFNRLTVAFDPVWMRIVSTRGPYLFPTLWPLKSWSLLAWQVTIGALAASLPDRRLSKTLMSVAAVALGGILVASLVPTVLIVQAQLWRAQWLLSFFAAATTAIVSVELWRRGGASRLALAMLLVALIGRDNLAVCGLCCAVAIGLRFSPKSLRIPFALNASVWAVATIVAISFVVVECIAYIQVYSSLPPSEAGSLGVIMRSGVQSILLPAGAVMVVIFDLDLKVGSQKLVAGLGAIAIGLVLYFGWDSRPAAVRAREDGAGSAQLRAAIPSGTVQWSGGNGTSWLQTGRPEWWSEIQGAGTVFDRDLALEWQRRFEILFSAGLVPADADAILEEVPRPSSIRLLSSSSLREVCRAADPPDWIVAPIAQVDGGVSAELAEGTARIWRAPQEEYRLRLADMKWAPMQDYAVFACPEVARAIGPQS